VVRFANKTVERMLQSDFGMAIRHGRLIIQDTKAQQAVQKALENVQKTSTGAMVPWRDKLDRPVSLLITPLNRGTKAMRLSGPVAAIFINNPEERRKPSETVIGAIYGLTPAEAKLTKALLEGRHLQDYAEQGGISLHTAKTQLKQIFMKTGHGRQSDLLRDIMANPVLRMRL
jgi:DNA-binding CsgD family transcriptional regulator